MSNLNAQGRLLGNMQATTTELLEQTLKERGRGFASDREAWALLKENIENIETRMKTIKDLHKDMWSAVKDHNEDAFCALSNEFQRSALMLSITIVTIVPEDVAALLGLLKIARIATGHGKDDNWIDLAGYAACGGELQQNMGAAEMKLSQLACDHEWELSGTDTGGLSYTCNKCGAQNREPAGKRLDITTNSAETAGGCYE